MTTLDRYLITKISRLMAKPFIEKHHYTKSIGKVSIAYGLFDKTKTQRDGLLFVEPILAGVITYGQVSCRDLAQSIGEGLNQYNCWEFLRMAVKEDCQCPRSYFISKTIKSLKRDFPKIRCLVSFADQTEGHFGYVYQASNWLYCGQTGRKYHYKLNDKRINKRVAFDKAKNEGIAEKAFVVKYGWEKIIELPKFRYIYLLDKKISLKQNPLPYPKERVLQVDIANKRLKPYINQGKMKFAPPASVG